MDKIRESSKRYEELSTKFDPHYDLALKAIPIIKKFIIDRGLIIYGGTAIDYALRLKGDAIYPDESLDIPDLDFYSPNNVKDAYDLADILYKSGFPESRAIVATYVRTMRVDIVDNHFLADISYVPPEIFENMSYIEYEGMRVISPIFQKIDLHSSLSFPFDNPPREVIFARWEKDIKRFNLLHKYYPTEIKGEKPALKKIRISPGYRKFICNGFIGYAVIFEAFRGLATKVGAKISPKIVQTGFFVGPDVIEFEAPTKCAEFLHYDGDILAEKMKLSNVKYYYPYFNMLPERMVAADGDLKIDTHIFKHRYISIHRVTINDTLFTVVGIQYLLMYFLVLAQLPENKKKSAIFYTMYESLLAIISEAEKILDKLPDSDDKNQLIKNSPFFPAIKVYGFDNYSEAYEISIYRTLHDIDKKFPLPKLPFNYYPARGYPQPAFDYESSKYFIKDGRARDSAELEDEE